jgi:hypothetical protein
MKVPFTTQQFLDVFSKYNREVFPVQLLFVMMAVFVVWLAFRRAKNVDRPVMLILSLFWLWMGVVYHIGFFAAINQAAYGFGLLFIIQGILLFYGGVNTSYHFIFRTDMFGFAGGLLILYSLIIYPLVGHVFGHRYPFSPTFGLPCPTTLFTIGILLLSQYRLSWIIVIIPVLWSAIGFIAAFTLGIFEDSMLALAGLLLTVLNALKMKEPVIATIKSNSTKAAAVS